MHFASTSTKFKCIRCAKCCSFDVSLTDEELRNFGENVDIKWRTTKRVIRDNIPVCYFLNGNICSVYEKRPKI
ncbi:MAG: YkgJ family cysteine cluster protein, partial [Candidatus Methanomethyliaceae archaeon]|nr:YkgJ family cysteine cluster protein [Candidatus Methanomethyliaceae archaeon]